jgi:glutamate N-acetyltransferase/amino-acid N-acetyltransferase
VSLPEVDPTGLPTTAHGFTAGATYAGIKTFGEGKLDVALLASDRPCTVAGVFTKSVMHSAPVDLDREHMDNGKGQAVVVNAGVANASTGSRGLEDARTMAVVAGRKLAVAPDDMFVCSTGVIGQFLPMDRIEKGISAVKLTREGGDDFTRAIMTTDTRPKHGAVRFGPYTLGGCCKGSGMIHPNMATMLAFLTTDATIAQPLLQKTFARLINRSFNRISVDGDMSTNDMATLMANGLSGAPELVEGTNDFELFEHALEHVLICLAKMIARDGEGATKLVEIIVNGARTEAEALQAARAVANSNLVKTAIHGADANWGRILAAVGYSGIDFDPANVQLFFNELPILEKSYGIVIDQVKAKEAFSNENLTITINLNQGSESANFWTCDLSKEYVHINASYRS